MNNRHARHILCKCERPFESHIERYMLLMLLVPVGFTLNMCRGSLDCCWQLRALEDKAYILGKDESDVLCLVHTDTHTHVCDHAICGTCVLFCHSRSIWPPTARKSILQLGGFERLHPLL